jgi:hypothetical protein
MDIPEYYKQFQNQPPNKEAEVKKPEKIETPSLKPQQNPEVQKQSQAPAVKDKTVLYQGNGFALDQPEDWDDKTIYTLSGPVSDGIQHNVIVIVDKKPSVDNLIEYADLNITTLEKELKSCLLLKRGETKLKNGTNAYEAIFSWYPTDDLQIYQHQIFVFDNKVAYKLTASFTKKTRQTIGPAVLRMMLSINFSPKK